MDKEHKTNNSADYQIGNTQYTVTPVFDDAAGKENIEEKIKRLILQDTKLKGINP